MYMRSMTSIPATRARGIPLLVALFGCTTEPTGPAGPADDPAPDVPAAATAPSRVDLDLLSFQLVDANGNPAPFADPGTPLFRLTSATTWVPLTDPSGAQLTWGQWSPIEGRVAVQCIEHGTHVTVHVKNAIPNAVYTIWLLPFGPLGAADGSENVFRTSTAGEGQISVIDGDPTCALTAVPVGGSVLIIPAYHMDNQSHGAGPGPASTQAFHAIAVFTRTE